MLNLSAHRLLNSFGFRISIFVLLLTSLVFSSIPVSGQGAISPTIGVSPAKFFETVEGGKTSQHKVRLRNLGVDPLPLAVSTTEIDGVSDQGAPVFTDRVAPRSARHWIKVDESDVIVRPGETREVNFSVSPPPNAVPGGYLAALVFQAQLPSYYFDLDASARILPAITVLVFLTIPGAGEITVDKMTIEQLRVPRIVVSAPVSLVANIKNDSAFFVQTDAEARIENVLTNRVTSSNLGTVILLPEKSRRFVTAFEQSFFPGLYSASINFKQGDETLVGAVKFVALPWPFILALVLLTIVGLGLASRRRFKRAWLALRGRDDPPDHRAPKRRAPTIR